MQHHVVHEHGKIQPMQKKQKSCFFQIDGPVFRKHSAQKMSYVSAKVNTLLEYPDSRISASPNEVVELPCVRFQAQMTFVCMLGKRVLMKDRFGREWSVYASFINQLVPAMNKGVIECWWEIVKKSNVYGLTADVSAPVGPVGSNQDVPLMLDTAFDLRSCLTNFEAMAV